jgi:DNA-binding transcriptional LysR family regulator
MALSLRKLEVFVRIASSGQVTRVSEELSLSQSAVSMALASLEQEHGGQLFQRQGRQLLLNDRGRLLLPYAQDILQQVNNFTTMLEDSQDHPMGHLHIGASTTIGNYLLPLLLARFSGQYPQSRVQLQIANSEQIAQAVRAGQLDLGLIEGPCHLDQLVCSPWRDDELVVISAAGHPWTQLKMVDRKKLLSADWIVREAGSGTREVFEAALGCALAQMHLTLELGHTEAIKKAVEAGLGVSCLSRFAVQVELDLGRLVAIKTPLNLKRQLSLLIHAKRYKTKLLQACITLLNAPASV